MRRTIWLLQLVVATWTHPLHNPFEHVYPLAYPHTAAYSDLNYGYNYAPQVPTYSSYIPTYTNEYVQDYVTGYAEAMPEVQSTLNVLAELPYAISNQFSVVPMFIVSKSTMNMVSQGHITAISKEQPVMTVKVGSNHSIQCTPAVRMVLEKPIIVGSLKSNILFPSEVQIIHEKLRIPMRIGAVIAPVLPHTYVSQERPVSIRVVYAIPTKPIKITITIEQENDSHVVAQSPVTSPPTSSNADKPASEPPQRPAEPVFGALSPNPDYVNNADAQIVPNQEAVVVESELDLPPKNITVINFPEQEAEPNLEVDEEDEELVNRNPPLVLAPAGIVQSTQPQAHVEPFHNDKESPYLETLREQSKKKIL